MRHLYEECAGGLDDPRPLRAILPGGPSSGFLGPDGLDLPLDYQAFRDAGSSLGCGVMTFYPEGTCMVEETLRIAQFFAAESCGQCPACQMETQQLVRILQQVQAGKANAAVLGSVDRVIQFARGKVQPMGPGLKKRIFSGLCISCGIFDEKKLALDLKPLWTQRAAGVQLIRQDAPGLV